MKTPQIAATVVLTFLFVHQTLAQGPTFTFAKTAGGLGNDVGRDIVTDASGNSYVTGTFQDTAFFGAVKLVSAGGTDIFLARYDANGNVVWATRAGGISDDYSYGIALDSSGNVHICGYFQGVAQFDTVSLTSSALWDIFVAKYDAGGHILWARTGAGTAYDIANGIATDAGDNVYITGPLWQTLRFGTDTLTSSGQNDMYLVKYGPSGSVQWARKGGGADSDYGNDVTVDKSGNVFVVGQFGGTAVFGTDTVISVGGYDAFLAKYTSAGALVWIRSGGGAANEYAYDVATDPTGAATIVGEFADTAHFGGTTLVSTAGPNSNPFIVRYSPAGDVRWSRRLAGSDASYSEGNTVDGNGTITLAGAFNGTLDCGVVQLQSKGGQDLFIAQIDSNNVVQWAKNMGGALTDFDVAVSHDGGGNIYGVGAFSDKAYFGSDSVTSSGGYDVVLVKIGTAVATAVGPSTVGHPSTFGLSQNYPNPFNPSTTIEFTVPERSRVRLIVYSVLGQEIARLIDEERPSGLQQVSWNAQGISSGVYFYRLQSGELSMTRKLVIAK